MIGDHDPEDEYDASDPIPERLRVIVRVVASIAEDTSPYRAAVRRAIAARMLRNLADDLEGRG